MQFSLGSRNDLNIFFCFSLGPHNLTFLLIANLFVLSPNLQVLKYFCYSNHQKIWAFVW
jgi:hypothetical protein